VVVEQTSPAGSASLMSVNPLAPSSVKLPVPLELLITPLVWPLIRLIAPTVDGPYVVPYELSLMA